MQELLELLPKNEKIFLMNEMKNLLKDNPSFVGAYLVQIYPYNKYDYIKIKYLYQII